MVNKLGQTRVAQYFGSVSARERKTLESELVRKCLSRSADKCFVFSHLSFKVVYRRYASLYFILGIDESDADVPFLDLTGAGLFV